MIQPLAQISAPMRALSAYIAEALSHPLPPEVGARAEHHVLDTLAAMISGSRLSPGRHALDFVAAQGGMLAHADETDDSHAASRTHPGCAVLPAALAAAERAEANGTQFLRAVVLGYDVTARAL